MALTDVTDRLSRLEADAKRKERPRATTGQHLAAVAGDELSGSGDMLVRISTDQREQLQNAARRRGLSQRQALVRAVELFIAEADELGEVQPGLF